MMTLTFAFWLFVVLFASIGAMRGWAKELIVTFSVILALFFLEVLGRYFPPIRDFLAKPNGSTEFWVRAFVLTTFPSLDTRRLISPSWVRHVLPASDWRIRCLDFSWAL